MCISFASPFQLRIQISKQKIISWKKILRGISSLDFHWFWNAIPPTSTRAVTSSWGVEVWHGQLERRIRAGVTRATERGLFLQTRAGGGLRSRSVSHQAWAQQGATHSHTLSHKLPTNHTRTHCQPISAGLWEYGSLKHNYLKVLI